MKFITLTVIINVLFFLTTIKAQERSQTSLSAFVDPFIGTQGNGNTFPGATYPFGMVKLGPDCDDLGTNMGYKESGKIRGFSHLHVSGTGGGPKYGNILVYPFNGDIRINGYGSDRGKETATAGYFSAELKEPNILAELTATPKTGIHRYTFNKAGQSGMLIDAGSILGKNACCHEEQKLLGSEIEIRSNTEITGYNRVSGGWNIGAPFTVYFYAQFNTPAESFGTWKSGTKHPGNKMEYDSGEPVGAWFSFNKNAPQQVEVRVGISFISIGKAKENFQKEAAGLTFEQAVAKAKAEWDSYLGRMEIATNDKTEKVKFYTALYHTLMQPTDKTGENALWKSDAPYFDDFYCIWDTYRTSHPLITLIAPEKESQIVNSLIDTYKNEGYLPDGRSGNSNGRTQGGSNADMVLAEAVLKDLKGINYADAFEAMLKDAEVPPGSDERKEGRGGLKDYNTLGYVSTDYERAGTRTVEYAANDWAIAQVALKLGKKDDYNKYAKRAGNWENLWKPVVSDGAKGFIMPRKADGTWDETFHNRTWQYYLDFSPSQIGIIPYKQLSGKYLDNKDFTVLSAGNWSDFFYESHSWEYSFYVPHDMSRLIEKSGGRRAFVNRLDTFFLRNYYNIANEPGFLTPHLYIYAGQHHKTVSLINKLLKKYYTDKADGLPGNDDSGAMSSWYVFNKAGIFPNAGQDVYLITAPGFKKVTIHLDSKTKLDIVAENLSPQATFIKSAELNGKRWNKAWFKHADIKRGGVLKLVMSNNPSDWSTKELPPSRSDDKQD
ncbi:GH92 family glycosyl hydrolase [Mucilaginibacter lacusdianchii]|uniref:GH92 family glycosyl hydrolase n=1 Tax=Mucilaginibacter lacusdianchii TaxID=2684211 RepID=UPI00131C5BF1|nr:GH92 family glycosyl hydrolase [Mucilaginibacter sp. JXJ CY 39]